MELILMSGLSVLAVCVGIYIGRQWGIISSYQVGYDEGYEQGQEDAKKDMEDDFPKTLDGRFYSTDTAIKGISVKK